MVVSTISVWFIDDYPETSRFLSKDERSSVSTIRPVGFITMGLRRVPPRGVKSRRADVRYKRSVQL